MQERYLWYAFPQSIWFVNKVIVQSSRRLSKLIRSAGRKQSYTSWKLPLQSMQQNICFKFFLSFLRLWQESLFTHVHCLRIVWQCPYILGFSSAGAMRLYRSNSQSECFPANWILFYIRKSFPPRTICNIQYLSILSNIMTTSVYIITVE